MICILIGQCVHLPPPVFCHSAWGFILPALGGRYRLNVHATKRETNTANKCYLMTECLNCPSKRLLMWTHGHDRTFTSRPFSRQSDLQQFMHTFTHRRRRSGPRRATARLQRFINGHRVRCPAQGHLGTLGGIELASFWLSANRL
jgi:hypothetical protein